jgi:hypothetical protein
MTLLIGLFSVPVTARGVEHRSRSDVVTLRMGDIVKVSGAPVGCVARQIDGFRAIDCRRIGSLSGTFGTILTSSRALVVRFDSSRTAQVVFVARHHIRRTRTCGGKS